MAIYRGGPRNPPHPDVASGRFKTGAWPSPAAAILQARRFLPRHRAIGRAAWIPAQLDMWNNGTYGDCVSAEEAFAKGTGTPSVFIPEQTVVAWAQAGGFLDGADLSSVLQAMASNGFQIGSELYNDGQASLVDYSHETTLQAALDEGPVKIAISSSDLPSGAGNQMGWYVLDGAQGGQTDHCVSLCGYGPAEYLFAAINTPLPSELSGKQGYLLYTWKTIGFVDYAWLSATCSEAWIRTPTTIAVPPLPVPGPTPTPPVPPTPTPPVPPTPTPPVPPIGDVLTLSNSLMITLAPGLTITLPAGAYAVGQGVHLQAIPWNQLLALLVAILQQLLPLLPQRPLVPPPHPGQGR